MDSNTHSTRPPDQHPDELADLIAALDRLAARDLDRLADPALAERVLVLRSLADRLDGQWLRTLAAVDARGAAGAEQGLEVGSTAGWLRTRLRMAAGTASTAVKTARALFRGPLVQTAQALVDGEVSAAHASVAAHGTQELPEHVRGEADPVVADAARHLDPRQLRHVVGQLRQLVDPDGADAAAQRRHARRGLWLTPTIDQLVAIDGLLEPEAGQVVLAALEPLARPADAGDDRSGSQRTADALTELARRSLEGGGLPVTGGVRPQLNVVVDLETLLGHPGAVGGELGGFGSLGPEGCRRLACDGAVTRVVVTRQQPGGHSHAHARSDPGPGPDPGSGHGATAGPRPLASIRSPDAAPGVKTPNSYAPPGAGVPSHHDPPEAGNPTGQDPPPGQDPCCPSQGTAPRATWLRDALTLLPRLLGGAPSQPLDVGRTSRVVTPTQRHALAVRDGGCVFPGCSRPLVWCDAHHLWHWLDGGPTDLANLVLLCRAHHRAVHEGGWHLTRDPDGGVTATPPSRRHPRPHPSARRHPSVA